ncbi:MAG: SWIM zinc finger family protein [Tabrizicola flagellatus]
MPSGSPRPRQATCSCPRWQHRRRFRSRRTTDRARGASE